MGGAHPYLRVDVDPPENQRYRPTCMSCGFKDPASFTGAQLDVYDFKCPECGSDWFGFPMVDPAPSPTPEESE